MTHLRISEAADLLGVSNDTLRRWIDRGELTAQVDATGRKVVDGAELARLAQQRAAAPPEPDSGPVSARNTFRGLVTAVRSDEVMSQVDLQCGPYRVVSLISTEAVRELGLQPGSLATARIKATSVMIDGTDR